MGGATAMNVNSILDYIRLITVASYHNNVGIESVIKLYDANITIGGTEQFWVARHRSVNGEPTSIGYPVYNYKYFATSNGKAIKYGDINASELKQALKNGAVEKKTILKSYKDIKVFSIDNTLGDAFNADEYKINTMDVMNRLTEFDIEKVILGVIRRCNIETGLEQYVRDAVEYALGIGSIEDTPRSSKVVYAVAAALVDVFNTIDNIVNRPKMIDIKQKMFDDVVDTIICGIDAQNVRALIGGE